MLTTSTFPASQSTRHDPTGNTVYVTVAGIESPHRASPGGVSLDERRRNLDEHCGEPARSRQPTVSLIDPQNANTVYIATDEGVYFTTKWQIARNRLPAAGRCSAPVCPALLLLRSVPLQSSSAPVLVAATYGRGIWQNRVMERGDGPDRSGCKPFVARFSKPGLRHRKQRDDRDTQEHRQPRAHDVIDLR